MESVDFQTSGSSGAAKHIVRSESSLQADAACLVATFPDFWSNRPPVVTTIPADHMYGALWRVRAPRLAGSPVEPETVLSAEGLVAAHARYGRYLLVTTPSFLEKLLTHPDAGDLRGAFVGIVTSGSLLRTPTALAAAEAFGTCPTEIFGSTETGTVAWRRQTEGAAWHLVEGVTARADAEGRIVVVSPFAMERPYVMSDAVEFLGERQFLLKGRTDRRVKILEQFVSLPDVEEAFGRHALVDIARVEAYGEGVARLGALVVLTASGRDELARTSSSELVARLRADLLPTLGAAAFPRRVRFVRALPVNDRGKTTAAAARNLLLAWCREPVVRDWTQDEKRLSARLTFVPDMECFSGHFPGFPVLPGVAQLYFIRHFAQQAFADFPDAATYRRLKFQQLTRPGAEILLTVERRADGVFAVSLVGARGPCCCALVERTVAT